MDKEDEEKGEEEEAGLVRCSKAVGEVGLGKERGGRDRRQSREAPTLASSSTSPNLPFNNIFLIPTILFSIIPSSSLSSAPSASSKLKSTNTRKKLVGKLYKYLSSLLPSSFS